MYFNKRIDRILEVYGQGQRREILVTFLCQAKMVMNESRLRKYFISELTLPENEHVAE